MRILELQVDALMRLCAAEKESDRARVREEVRALLESKQHNAFRSDPEYLIRQILLECPSSQEIRRMLSLVQLDMDAFYQLYSNEKIEQAILYAKDLKDRYTVLWLYYDMFGGEHDV